MVKWVNMDEEQIYPHVPPLPTCLHFPHSFGFAYVIIYCFLNVWEILFFFQEGRTVLLSLLTPYPSHLAWCLSGESEADVGQTGGTGVSKTVLPLVWKRHSNKYSRVGSCLGAQYLEKMSWSQNYPWRNWIWKKPKLRLTFFFFFNILFVFQLSPSPRDNGGKTFAR